MGLAGIGFIKDDDSYQAGFDACKAAIEKVDNKPDFLIIFTTDEYHQELVLRGVNDAAPSVPLSGCCGAGLVVNEMLTQRGIAVLAVSSDIIKFENGIVENISEDSFKSGYNFSDDFLNDTDHYKTLLLFPDGLTGNIPLLLDGLYEKLGASCSYIGGGTGDNLKFTRTCQFYNNRVYQNSMSYSIISSVHPPGMGVKHGWISDSEPLLITRAEGNTIYEIEGRPALEIYQERINTDKLINENNFSYFAASHPFGIIEPGGEDTIRDPILCSDKDQSITCIAAVPENSVVKIMSGKSESLINAAREAAHYSKDKLEGKKPLFLLVVVCVSRLIYLSDKAIIEIEAIHSVFGKDIPILGIFSYGEIAPKSIGIPVFHNKTIVVSAFCE